MKKKKKIQSIINCENINEADVVLLSAGYDRNSTMGKGAAKGPEAIVKCLNEDIEFFDRYSKTEPNKFFKIFHE